MAQQRHLDNAPITEAIIDFRVRIPSGADPGQFSSLKKELKDRYPHVVDMKMAEMSFRMIDDKPVWTPPGEGRIIGYRFESEDKKNVAQFRNDGFTFSRLKPYNNWEHIFEEARNLWSLYVRIASPESIARIATRYINRLKIPLPVYDFKQYLTSSPQIPESLPQGVSSFLSRVLIYDPKLDIAANVTQAFEANVEESNFVIIIIDIDAYKRGEFNPEENNVWDYFAELRDMKNRIFFEHITEDAARLFE